MADAMGDTKLPGDEGIRPGGPYIMELLFDEPPKLDRKALAAELAPRVGRLDGPEDSCMFALLDHTIEMAEGRMPVMLSFMEADRENRPKDPLERFASALQQTWDWDGAREVLARCQYTLLFTDFLAGALPAAERVE